MMLSAATGLSSGQMALITLMLLGQNASFTLVSRARQTSNLVFHSVAALASNGLFIFIITAYAANYNNFWLKIWYIVCTVIGSVIAHHISMHKIEKTKAFKKDTMVTFAELDRLSAKVTELERRLEQPTALSLPA